MKDILIAVGVVGLIYLIAKRTAPPSMRTPTSAQQIGSQVVVGDGYAVAPSSSLINALPLPSSAAGLPSTVAYPTGYSPPPSVVGGIFGGAGTGGLPLGGPIVPGVSTGPHGAPPPQIYMNTRPFRFKS